MFNIDVYYWPTVVRTTFASTKRSARVCTISINSAIAALFRSAVHHEVHLPMFDFVPQFRSIIVVQTSRRTMGNIEIVRLFHSSEILGTRFRSEGYNILFLEAERSKRLIIPPITWFDRYLPCVAGVLILTRV